MSTSARVADPSMEEILASIRRIIADDMPARVGAQVGRLLPEIDGAVNEEPAGDPTRELPPVDAAPAAARPIPLRTAPREPSLFSEHTAFEPPASTQSVPDQFLGAMDEEIEAEVALALRGAVSPTRPVEVPPAPAPRVVDAPAARDDEPRPAADAARPFPSFAPPPATAARPAEPRPFSAPGAPYAARTAAAPPASSDTAGGSARPPFSFGASARAPGSTPASERLVSPPTNAAVAASFGTLARTIMTGNNRSLEDVVGELLKPMLRSWLDDNLPAIVERLVKAEIERVSRGGR